MYSVCGKGFRQLHVEQESQHAGDDEPGNAFQHILVQLPQMHATTLHCCELLQKLYGDAHGVISKTKDVIES